MKETRQPTRIQRKRVKGFDLQAESMERNGLPCVYVGRPTKFGNDFTTGSFGLIGNERKCKYLETRQDVIAAFERQLKLVLAKEPDFLDELRGKNLACFCKESEPCHADILLELANN